MKRINMGVRMSEALHHQLTARSADTGRSMNQLALEAIQRFLDPQQEKVPVVDALREVWNVDFAGLEERVLARISQHPAFVTECRISGDFDREQVRAALAGENPDLSCYPIRVTDDLPPPGMFVPVPEGGIQPLPKGETVAQSAHDSRELSGLTTLTALAVVRNASSLGHLITPGALEWDQQTAWRINDGQSPVGRFVGPDTLVEVRTRRSKQLGMTPMPALAAKEWIWLLDEKEHAGDILEWRLAQ